MILLCGCCQRGDVLRIIRMTADGWWLAQDSKGNKGVVPKTYLKVCSLLNICITASCLADLLRIYTSIQLKSANKT